MSKRHLLLYFGVYLFYLALAVVITYPLVTQFSTHFAGDLPGPGDAYEYVRHIWWFKHALQTGQPLFFHPLFAYPDGIPGAHLWANLLQSFPASLFAFFMPLPAAFNLMILLRLAFNGWAMWFLSCQLLAVSRQQEKERKVQSEKLKEKASLTTFDFPVFTSQSSVLSPSFTFPTLLAGVIYLAFPTVQSHLAASHSGLLALWQYPLYIYALLRVQATGKRRWYGLSALFFVLGGIGNYALVLYVLAPVTAFFVLARLIKPDWVGLRRVITAALLGSLASLVFLVPAALEVLSQPAIQLGGAFNFSADLLTFAAPSPNNPLFSALDYPRYILGGNVIESAGYLGIGATFLALVGMIRFRAARGWLLLLLVAWVLSLGPLLKILDQPAVYSIGSEAVSYVTLPYALVQDLPLVNIARTPARFNFTVALALAVMAGYGSAALWGWLGKNAPLRVIRLVLFAILMAWIVFEYQLFFPLPTARADLPQALYDLAEREDIRAVFDIPWNSPAGKDALYLQTAHEHPMIAGSVTRGTPVDHAKLWLLQQTLNLALLDAAGVDVVILHRRWAETDAFNEAFTRAQLGEPFYEDDRFALFYTPDPVEPAGFISLPDPSGLPLGVWYSYFYAPEAGWAMWHGNLSGENVGVEVLLEDQRVHHRIVDGEMAVTLPLWLPSPGYYTTTVRLSPDCPANPPPPLRCRPAQLNGLTIDGFTPDADQSVHFERGVTLSAANVPVMVQAGGLLPIGLAWQFDEARGETDVRFVHVLNAEGELIAQEDIALGAHEAGSHWSEQVEIDLADLSPGDYRVFAGWYTYPEIVNFCVLENDTCVANEALIGVITIE